MGKRKYSPKNPRKRNPVGRPPKLTDELSLKIREQILLGHTHKKAQEILNIPEGTWLHWQGTNYHSFKDNLVTYDLEWQLKKAKENINDILNLETNEQAIGMFGPLVSKTTKKPIMKQNDKLMKIKSDVSVFVAETIGRKNYSKKIEVDDVTKKKKILLG